MDTVARNKLVEWALHLGLKGPVCEVGCQYPADCRTAYFATIGEDCTFIEPLKDPAAAIARRWPNATVYPYAITPLRGLTTMVEFGGRSHIKGVRAPITMHIRKWKRVLGKPEVQVMGVPIEELDQGDWNIMSIDVEGSEWSVLSTLVSRPKLIAIEMGSVWKRFKTKTGYYITPNTPEIEKWFRDNNYTQVDRDVRDWIMVKDYEGQ